MTKLVMPLLFHPDRFDLRTIYNELAVVKYKWFKIGIQLNVPHHKLKEFEKEEDPLAAVFDYWLKGNVEGIPLTWTSIVTALELSESGLAKRLKKKYCQEKENVDDGEKH